MLIDLNKEELVKLLMAAFEEGAVNYSEMKEGIAEKLAEEFIKKQVLVVLPPTYVPYTPTWDNSWGYNQGSNGVEGGQAVVNQGGQAIVNPVVDSAVYGGNGGNGVINVNWDVSSMPSTIQITTGSPMSMSSVVNTIENYLSELTIVGFDEEGYAIEAPESGNHGF